jgi:2-methylisocitrate lyase-like PEP mutase family enzyme
MTAHSPGFVLRQRMKAGRIVVAPGVYDAMSAWFAVQAGSQAVFVSGSAVAYSRLARPDVNLLTVSEVADVVARIRDRVGAPILVDADSGHGNALNVQRTVRLFERAGAAAVQIEDQLNHKPVSAPTSRPLISCAEMVGKIKAALDARIDSNTVISARTDAPYTVGAEEALDRARAFAEAGADMVFVEGLTDIADMRRLVVALGSRVPLLHNVVDGAGSPIQTAAEAEALGYSVVLFPGAAVQAAATGIAAAMRQVLRDGSTAALREKNLDAKALNTALEAPAFLDAAKKYAG